MPEMVAGGVAAWRGNTDIVLGNVFGSNIANIGLILGITALLRPIPVHTRVLRREMPIMLAVTVLVYLLASTGEIGRLAGVGLLGALLGFTWLTLRWARGETELAPTTAERERAGIASGSAPQVHLGVECGRVVAGLVGLVVGAHLLVGSALQLARAFGVSEFVISVSVVALGTSLPELATSVVAAMRGETDVLVGQYRRQQYLQSARRAGRRGNDSAAPGRRRDRPLRYSGGAGVQRCHDARSGFAPGPWCAGKVRCCLPVTPSTSAGLSCSTLLDNACAAQIGRMGPDAVERAARLDYCGYLARTVSGPQGIFWRTHATHHIADRHAPYPVARCRYSAGHCKGPRTRPG